jgi:hypothetical protein
MPYQTLCMIINYTCCSFVLVASSFGRSLGQEVAGNGAGVLLAPDGKSVAKPLLKAASEPVLTHWLKQLAQCSRLYPVEKRVWIIVNRDHLPLYQAWARCAGFPVSNIISNGACKNQGLDTAMIRSTHLACFGLRAALVTVLRLRAAQALGTISWQLHACRQHK